MNDRDEDAAVHTAAGLGAVVAIGSLRPCGTSRTRALAPPRTPLKSLQTRFALLSESVGGWAGLGGQVAVYPSHLMSLAKSMWRRSFCMKRRPMSVNRVSWQFPQTEAYGAFLPPAGTTLPATGTSGTLRLTRQGDIFTAYYLSGRTWIPIISGTGPTGDVPLTLAVFNISAAATFAGEPVTVAFDNFHVVADRVVCP